MIEHVGNQVSEENLSEAEQIEFFFAPPVPQQQSGRQSTLHLLRRELQDCFVGEFFANEFEPLSMPAAKHRRLFATCLVLWSGIDLSAKFYAGTVDGSVADRFKTFVREVMLAQHKLAEEGRAITPDVLYYGLRNPMVHSFGLTSGKHFSVYLSGGNAEFLVYKHSDSQYVVNIGALYGAFINSIQIYRSRLDEPDLRTRFLTMFPTLGSMGVTTVEQRPFRG
jgi:hypothetical protein